MRRLVWTLVIFYIALGVVHCGGRQASEKVRRKSERYYEAASIAWFEQNNALAAIRNLTRSIDANPDNDHAHYLLGIIRFGRNEFDEAEQHFLATIRLREETDPAGLAGARNNLGLLYIHRKRFTEAVNVLKLSAKEVLNNEPWLAMGNLGWAYIELGEYDQAIEILRRAIFEQPKFCVGLYRLGEAYYFKKEYEKAEKSLAQARTIDEPGCDAMQEAYHLHGMVFLRLGRDDEAKSAFERCRELDEESELGIKCAEAMMGL